MGRILESKDLNFSLFHRCSVEHDLKKYTFQFLLFFLKIKNGHKEFSLDKRKKNEIPHINYDFNSVQFILIKWSNFIIIRTFRFMSHNSLRQGKGWITVKWVISGNRVKSDKSNFFGFPCMARPDFSPYQHDVGIILKKKIFSIQ